MNDWNVIWSADLDGRIACASNCQGGLLVSSDLSLSRFDMDGGLVWKVETPFRIHHIVTQGSMVGVLAAHGFIPYDLQTGQQIHEGRATYGGFSDILPRPGGGWVASGRKGDLHIFNQNGKGLRRCTLNQFDVYSVGWTVSIY